MGIEYYIIKPSTKEKFYLGKHWGTLEGIVQWCHHADINYEGAYTDYECFNDFVVDVIDNLYDVLPSFYTWESILDFLYKIYEFIQDKVYIDNDCSDNTSWVDYKKIDYKSDYITIKEQMSELILLIPKEKWVVTDHILNEFETLKTFIEENI